MKIERTKNAARNIVFGTIYKIIGIILPFLSRTVILYVLGEKYLGLSSLFSSILSFLSLAELGIGAAMVYSMYKPIADNDHDSICALLNLYKKLYRIIGTCILVIGLCVLPFLRRFIKGDVPSDVNIYFLYLLYLVNAVLSYWLFAYKGALIQAHQRSDIDSKIGSMITPVSYIVMLVALVITKNYYAYVIWLPIFTIITNIIRSIYVDRHFPGLKPKGDVSKEVKASINKKVKALIGTKLNTVVINAADNIVMSAYLGLTVIAIYGNYRYIMTSIIGFLSICYSALTAGIGNSLVLESPEKNYSDFLKLSFINSWLVGWCTVCLVCLYQPFMLIWTGEDLMFSLPVVFLLGVYFFVYQIRKIPVVYKDAAGIWWEDRFRPYTCMALNFVLDLILVRYLGVAGIIIATIASLAISIPWENYTIFKYVLHRSSKEYYLKMLLYAATMLAGGALTYWICGMLGQGIVALLLRAVICLILPNAVFVLANFKRREFKQTIELVRNIFSSSKRNG